MQSERIKGGSINWLAHIYRATLTLYFPNNDLRIILPILRSKPAFEVGMPVSRANFCFACVTPNALFHEKDNPGMPVFDLRLAIVTMFFGGEAALTSLA